MTDLVRQKLQALISQFGVAVCNDVKRCEALLKDLCPQNKREVPKRHIGHCAAFLLSPACTGSGVPTRGSGS